MTKKNPNARPLAAPLDEPRVIRKFWMSTELRDATQDLAYRERSTLSELVREALADVRVQPVNSLTMSVNDSPSSKHSVSVAVDDELYFGAKDAAYPTRKSVTSLVRRRLIRRLEEAGMWTKENGPVAQLN